MNQFKFNIVLNLNRMKLIMKQKLKKMNLEEQSGKVRNKIM